MHCTQHQQQSQQGYSYVHVASIQCSHLQPGSQYPIDPCHIVPLYGLVIT